MTSDGQGPSYDVVVIGASQAGLAMGYHLAQKGLRFVILDAGTEIAGTRLAPFLLPAHWVP